MKFEVEIDDEIVAHSLENATMWGSDWTAPEWLHNLITDSNFIDLYLNSLEKIVNNMTKLVEQIEEWFDFIEPTAILPFQYTDPFPDLIWEWMLNIEPSWFYYDKSRVLSFLGGRTQFVISQLP